MQISRKDFWPFWETVILFSPAPEPNLGGFGAIEMVFYKPKEKFFKREVMAQVLKEKKKTQKQTKSIEGELKKIKIEDLITF